MQNYNQNFVHLFLFFFSFVFVYASASSSSLSRSLPVIISKECWSDAMMQFLYDLFLTNNIKGNKYTVEQLALSPFWLWNMFLPFSRRTKSVPIHRTFLGLLQQLQETRVPVSRCVCFSLISCISFFSSPFPDTMYSCVDYNRPRCTALARHDDNNLFRNSFCERK